MAVLPHELQVWYVLPALRKEIALALIKNHKLPQKKVAQIMGLSEAAVSQYMSSKRGNNMKFSTEIMQRIEAAGDRINANNSVAMEELIRLSETDEVKVMVCQLHKEREPSLSMNCSMCFRR